MTNDSRPDRHKMPGPRLSGSLTDEQFNEIKKLLWMIAVWVTIIGAVALGDLVTVIVVEIEESWTGLFP